MGMNTNNKMSTSNKAKKEVVNTYSSLKTSIKRISVTKYIWMILLLVIVIVIIILWGRAVSNINIQNNRFNPILVPAPVNAANELLGNKEFNVPLPFQEMGFTYSFWIYIEDWSYKFGHWKNIISTSDETSGSTPYIGLYPRNNSLHARIATSASANEGCDIPNIPLQKWVHIVYILDNRNVNIYINNKLARSCALKGIPIINHKPIHICHKGGFFGQIARVHYFSKRISQNKVTQLYYRGPFNSYKKYSYQLFKKTPFDIVKHKDDKATDEDNTSVDGTK